MLAIEAASVVDGDIDSSGHLILTTHGGTEIDAGSIIATLPIIRDMLYPVGVIYMSVNATSPATLFGGTWTAWGTGRVPVGVDTADTDFNTVEKVGGEKTHLLTAAEMPHTRIFRMHTRIPRMRTHTPRTPTTTRKTHTGIHKRHTRMKCM